MRAVLDKHHYLLALLLSASASNIVVAAPDDTSAHLKRGKDIALQLKGALGRELTDAMSIGGPANAVEFCNLNAVPISAKVSDHAGASVTRVSDRPRNPNNAANESELAYIATVKSLLASKEQPKPLMKHVDGRMVGYYPIMTNGMCLQCHGTEGKEITSEISATINARYPNDQATGYGLNELRGIFVVSMDPDS